MQECIYCNLCGYQESGHHGECLEGFKMWTKELPAFIYSPGNSHREVTNLQTISQEQQVIQKATHPCHRDGQRQIHQTDPKILTVQTLTQPSHSIPVQTGTEGKWQLQGKQRRQMIKCGRNQASLTV